MAPALTSPVQSAGVREVDVLDVDVHDLDLDAEELFHGLDHVDADALGHRLDRVPELDHERNLDRGDVALDVGRNTVGAKVVHTLGLAGHHGHDLRDNSVANGRAATSTSG